MKHPRRPLLAPILGPCALFCALVACGLMVAPAPAEAAADLQITAMSVQGTPRVGNCNKVNMTVRNFGDEFTGNATLDITLVTFPSSTPNQNRFQKELFISPLQGGAQVSFTIQDVEFKVAGQARVQGVVDSTSETQESNENNNTRTATVNVSGSCDAPPTRRPLRRADAGCDLELTFTAPTGSTISSNSNTTFTLQAKNVGSAACESTKLRLYRYNSGTASGYGSSVGGTRSIWTIPALQPGQAASNNWVENPRSKGTKTYAPKFLGPWNDENNFNHGPKKTVTAQ